MRVCKLLAAGLVLGSLTVAGFGCGQKSGVVKGTVAYKGQPLVVGSVTLMADNGVPFQGQIQPDGTFRVEGVPRGSYRVAVVSADPNPSLASPARNHGAERPKPRKEPPAGWFPIPQKYSQHDQSGLVVTVNGPDVTSDIKLTD